MYVKSVKATVVDLRSTDPKPEDEYLVDTNAWYWTAYTRASIPAVGQPSKYQSQQYPRFLKKALDKGAILHRCGLSLAELSHIIEECERQIFIEFINKTDMTPKEYRHSEEEERNDVVSEIESAWGQIKQMSQCLPLLIDDSTATAAISNLKHSPVDGYDVLFLEAMKQGKLAKIITDDSDFACIPAIEVFTCNPSLLELAERQGRLKKG